MKVLLVLALLSMKDMSIKTGNRYLFVQTEFKQCNFNVTSSYSNLDLHSGDMKCKNTTKYMTLEGDYIRNNAIPNGLISK